MGASNDKAQQNAAAQQQIQQNTADALARLKTFLAANPSALQGMAPLQGPQQQGGQFGGGSFGGPQGGPQGAPPPQALQQALQMRQPAPQHAPGQMRMPTGIAGPQGVPTQPQQPGNLPPGILALLAGRVQ